MQFPKLLLVFIFGNEYKKIMKYAVYNSKSIMVLHIASNSVLNSIFSLEKLTAFKFWRDKLAFHGCGKLHFKHGEKEKYGYIIEEKVKFTNGKMLAFGDDVKYHSRWTIRDAENNEYRINSPLYDAKNAMYVLKNCICNAKKFEILDNEYHPIRIVVYKKSEKITFAMDKCVLEMKKEGKSTIVTSSSS